VWPLLSNAWHTWSAQPDLRVSRNSRASSASNMREHNEELTLLETTPGSSAAVQDDKDGQREHHTARRADQNHRPIGHDGPL
jgi:hypothetical protein